MGIASSSARPDEPDSSLIIAAAAALTDLHELEEPTRLRWVVTDRMDRPRSTVFRLRLDGLAGEVPYLYYKQYCYDGRWTGERIERWASRVADSIERSQDLSQRFSELSKGTGIGISPILAVDPSRAVTVTGGVAGEPLGKPHIDVFTPSSRKKARHRYRQVGQAIAMLERLTEGNEVPDTYLGRRYFEMAVADLSDALTSGELEAFRDVLRGLHRDYLESGGRLRYYSHGDLSPSNVLAVPQGINLIDLSWWPRPCTYDLVVFLLRLELTSPSIGLWTNALTHSVLEGYGRPDVEKSPEFRLLRLGRMARRYRKLASSHRRKARRLLGEIRRSIASGAPQAQ